MFGLHEMQPWFEGSFTPFLTRVYYQQRKRKEGNSEFRPGIK